MTLEERPQVAANQIIDSTIEDQLNGSLHHKVKEPKYIIAIRFKQKVLLQLLEYPRLNKDSLVIQKMLTKTNRTVCKNS